jgi:hypothetical protein
MVTLIVDSPVTGGPSDKVSYQPGTVGTGDKSADKLVDRAIVACDPRIAVTGITAVPLSTPTQCRTLPWHPRP